MSDPLWTHGLQHVRLPCPSLSPGLHSNSCLLSQWCHQTISSSVTPFCCCPQSFPASGSFPVSRLFPSDGQSIGVSASASALAMNIQGWFPLGLTGLISLLSKGLSGVFSSTTVRQHHFFSIQPSIWSNSHMHAWLLEKPHPKSLNKPREWTTRENVHHLVGLFSQWADNRRFVGHAGWSWFCS